MHFGTSVLRSFLLLLVFPFRLMATGQVDRDFASMSAPDLIAFLNSDVLCELPITYAGQDHVGVLVTLTFRDDRSIDIEANLEFKKHYPDSRFITSDPVKLLP